MLFRIKDGETPLGFGSLILGFCEKNSEGKIVFYSLPQLLTDKQLNSSLGYRKDFQLSFAPFENTDFLVPQISKYSTAIVNEDDILDLNDETSPENILNRRDDEKFINDIMETVDECMMSGFKDYTADFLQFLEASVDCMHNINDNNFYYIIEPKAIPQHYLQYMTRYNNQTSGKRINYTEEMQNKNIAKEMQNYNDELSIRIPQIQYMDTSLPKYSEYLILFTQELFEQIDCIKPFKLPAIAINASNYKDYQDLEKMQVVPGTLSNFSMREIEGDTRNDALELQENEKKFYNRLIEMIDTCYEKYKALESDKTDSIIQMDKESCILHKELQDILEIFILFALNINWRFREYVPLEHLTKFYVDLSPSDDDDDDGEGTGTSEDEQFGLFSYAREANKTGLQINALVEDVDVLNNIRSFLTDSKVTVYAYAEVIIKLLRWGEVKPSRLHLNFPKSLNGVENSRYLNLSNLQQEFEDTVTEGITDFNDGYDATLISVVYSSKTDLDVVSESQEVSLVNKFGMEACTFVPKCILGVVLSQQISETQERFIYADLLTLTSYIRSGKYSVEGITFKDNKFIIDDNDEFYRETIIDEDGREVDCTTTVEEALITCERNKSLNKRLYYNESLVAEHPEFNLQQINSCNIFEVFNEMSSYNQVALYKTLKDKAVAQVHFALGIVLYKYFKKLESKDSIRLEESISLFLEALNDKVSVSEEPKEQEKSAEDVKTSLFESKPTTPVVKKKASYVLGYKNMYAVLVDNKEFFITSNLGDYDVTGVRSLIGYNGLLKIVGFAYAIQNKKDNKYLFSDEEISKLQDYLEIEFQTRNLVKVYNEALKKVKS